MRWLGAGLPVCGQCRQLPNPSCLPAWETHIIRNVSSSFGQTH